MLAAIVAAVLCLRPCFGRTHADSLARSEARSGIVATQDEQRFLDLVNRERLSRNLCELKLDPLLVAVAREHSREMCEKNYFDHQSPTPGQHTPMDRYLGAMTKRPVFACVGENLFYCSVVDVERGHQELMASPSHRANILFPRFRQCGVGIYTSKRGEFWVTEILAYVARGTSRAGVRGGAHRARRARTAPTRRRVR
jgi:uncharacterized protein YkwD